MHVRKELSTLPSRSNQWPLKWNIGFNESQINQRMHNQSSTSLFLHSRAHYAFLTLHFTLVIIFCRAIHRTPNHFYLASSTPGTTTASCPPVQRTIKWLPPSKSSSRVRTRRRRLMRTTITTTTTAPLAATAQHVVSKGECHLLAWTYLFIEQRKR